MKVVHKLFWREDAVARSFAEIKNHQVLFLTVLCLLPSYTGCALRRHSDATTPGSQDSNTTHIRNLVVTDSSHSIATGGSVIGFAKARYAQPGPGLTTIFGHKNLPLPGGIEGSSPELTQWERAISIDRAPAVVSPVASTPSKITPSAQIGTTASPMHGPMNDAAPAKRQTVMQAPKSNGGAAEPASTFTSNSSTAMRARLAGPTKSEVFTGVTTTNSSERIPLGTAILIIVFGTAATLGVGWLAVEVFSRRWKL